MTKTVKPKQGLVELIKQLRPMMPGKVAKVENSEFEWMIDDTVLVKLNYYCHWDPVKKRNTTDSKNCNPHSITVKLQPGKLTKKRFESTPVLSKVFTTRTISKRADGSFNLESVATAITKAINAYAEYTRLRKIREADEAKWAAQVKSEIKRIAALLPKETKTGSGYLRSGEVTIYVKKNANTEDGFYYNLNANGIKQEHLDLLLKALPVAELSVED